MVFNTEHSLALSVILFLIIPEQVFERYCAMRKPADKFTRNIEVNREPLYCTGKSESCPDPRAKNANPHPTVSQVHLPGSCLSG